MSLFGDWIGAVGEDSSSKRYCKSVRIGHGLDLGGAHRDAAVGPGAEVIDGPGLCFARACRDVGPGAQAIDGPGLCFARAR